MRLKLNELESITLGAQRVVIEDGKVRFHRFTREEEIFYKHRDDTQGRSFSARCAAPAGVRLSFRTDSKTLRIAAVTAPATSRSYFSFDVFENGKLVDTLDNFKDEDLLEDYTEQIFPLGRHEKTFSLSEGASVVTVYFPWSVFIDDMEVELDDGTSLEPVKPEKILLAYGDSITQGYDAMRPSNRYIAKLADFLGAQEINRAIGGEIFVPELVENKLDLAPDYISVAYGTNDWSTTDGKVFLENARRFYTSLAEHYPNSKIFAITPIWRANFEDDKPFGSFFSVEELIRQATCECKNVTVISGFDLVGHETGLFADLRLHPRDAGFEQYFQNLSKKIGELL